MTKKHVKSCFLRGKFSFLGWNSIQSVAQVVSERSEVRTRAKRGIEFHPKKLNFRRIRQDFTSFFVKPFKIALSYTILYIWTVQKGQKRPKRTKKAHLRNNTFVFSQWKNRLFFHSERTSCFFTVKEHVVFSQWKNNLFFHSEKTKFLFFHCEKTKFSQKFLQNFSKLFKMPRFGEIWTYFWREVLFYFFPLGT